MAPLSVLFFGLAISFAGVSSHAIALLQSESQIRAARRIAVFVGTFDPLHMGHQRIVDAVLSNPGIDLVLVIPNNLTFHKPEASRYSERREALEAVYGDDPEVLFPDESVGVIELGQSPYLTQVVDALARKRGLTSAQAALRVVRQFNPSVELSGVIGMDVANSWFLRALNRMGLHFFTGFFVPVWVDAGQQGDLMPRHVFGKPIWPIEISGLPRLSSRVLRAQVSNGVWPNHLDARLKPFLLRGRADFASNSVVELGGCRSVFNGDR